MYYVLLFFSPALGILMLLINFWVLFWLYGLLERFITEPKTATQSEAVASYCDIDPLLHPAFTWVDTDKQIGVINGVYIHLARNRR